MPPYTAVITTEILSNNTRNAPYYDIAHARDEGGKGVCFLCCNYGMNLHVVKIIPAVYKQGYLFSWASKYFGTRKRRWYRLFATTLYYVKFKREDLSCSMEAVADMSGCSVTAKPGDMPFLFTITPKGSNEIALQV